MPKGSKNKYTDKQDRQADHIEKSYEDKGVPKKVAESRAWATVNKVSGGGKKSGSGRNKSGDRSIERKGGEKVGSSNSSRSEAAKKGWETRRKNST